MGGKKLKCEILTFILLSFQPLWKGLSFMLIQYMINKYVQENVSVRSTSQEWVNVQSIFIYFPSYAL